jgi:PKD repeat protein
MFPCCTQRPSLSHCIFQRILLAVVAFFLWNGNLIAGTVTLAWDPVAASNLAGYKLSYGQNSGNYSSTVDVGNNTAYTLTGLEDGATYYVAVKAYDTTGTTESPYSNEVSATMPPTTSGETAGGTTLETTTGLVAAYGFDESNGTTVTDASGQGNHGTISGASRITTGRFGNALSFNGTSDWVTVNSSPSFDMTSSMTIEAWVYPTSTAAASQTLVTKEVSGNVAYYLAASSSSSTPQFSVITGGGAWWNLYGTSALAANTWVHLAATYDGTTQRLYINGTEVARRAQSGDMMVGSGALRIGGNSLWGEYFKGYIDEVRIYNRALTQAQIAADSQVAVSGSTSGSTQPVSLTADFTPSVTSGTAPLAVSFTPTTTGTFTSWAWDYGDGSSPNTGTTTTSTAPTAMKSYGTPGTYTVSLTVTGPNGSATKTKTDLITVTAAPPVANFTASATSGTGSLTVNFSDTSTGSISSRSWNFGDGTSSTAQNPAHTYAAPGTYTVSLTVTGPGGSDTETKGNYINVASTSTGGTSGGSTGGTTTNSTGLVAAYGFEEASGTTVADKSPQGNNGVISGASRTSSGRFGKALSFNGAGNWVTINDSPSLDLTNRVTVEAWVYPTTNMAGSYWRTVVAKEHPGGASYYLAANSDLDKPQFGIGTENWGWYKLYGGPLLAANTWTHLAATYDGTIQRLYVNGTQVASRAQTGNMMVSSGPLRIGGTEIWSEFFQGRIDEVRVYNRALSASEIQADMNAPVN